MLDKLTENWSKKIDLLSQKGHISNHHPATAFKPIQEDADDDMKAAEKIKRQLQNILFDIDEAESLISKNLSGFMAPGLKHAFYGAIKAGTKGRENLISEQQVKNLISTTKGSHDKIKRFN